MYLYSIQGEIRTDVDYGEMNWRNRLGIVDADID